MLFSSFLIGGSASTLDTVDIFGDGSGLALWQFNNDVLDVGETYDGTAGAGIYYESAKHGDGVHVGQDSTSYVDLNVPSPSGAFAFAGWVNVPDTATGQYIMGSNNNTNQVCRGFSLFISNTRVSLAVGNASTQSFLEPTIPDGFIGLHYIVIGINTATGNCMVDVDNGTYTDSSTVGHSITSGHYDVHIGRQGDSFRLGETTWDQLRYFSGTLTPSEINTLYNET